MLQDFAIANELITAGAGKSVLACVHSLHQWNKDAYHVCSASVINDLSDTINDGETLVYFYCDFRTRRSTNAVEVMRSILAQLMAQVPVSRLSSGDLLDQFLKESDSHTDRFYSVKGLSHYLRKAASLCSRTPVVVVDALDECREVESLLEGLIMCANDLQIFATSRPLQNVIRILSPFPSILMDNMAKELSADILLHIARELDSRRRLRTFDEGLKEEIRSKLCAKADGMYEPVTFLLKE